MANKKPCKCGALGDVSKIHSKAKCYQTFQKRAAVLAERIAAFSKESEDEEYTDTEQAWTLLNEAERLLKEAR